MTDLLRRWGPFALLVSAVVLGLALARALTAGRDNSQELARVREAAVLESQKFEVADRARTALAAEFSRLMVRNLALAAEVERLKRSSPGVRPVGTVSASTGPVPVSGAAPPVEPMPSAGSEARAPSPNCVLHLGEVASIDVAQVTLQTRAGNRVMVGQADAYRHDPAGRVRLFGGAFTSAITTEEADAPAPGWAFGVSAGVGTGGAVAGVAASPPPWGSLELVGTAGANPRGDWHATAALLWRFH